MSLDLGPLVEIAIVPAPVVYEVRAGNRYLHGLEDGEIRRWSEFCCFTLDERTGHFTGSGEYGSFDHFWPPRARSESLHSFLYDLDFDYFMKKAYQGEYRVFDADATVKEMRRQIKNCRRHGQYSDCGVELTKEEAREMWDETSDFLHVRDDQEYYHVLERASKKFLEIFWVDMPMSPYTMDRPSLRAFWDKVWLPFREEVLRPHWLEHIKKRPIDRRYALVALEQAA